MMNKDNDYPNIYIQSLNLPLKWPDNKKFIKVGVFYDLMIVYI